MNDQESAPNKPPLTSSQLFNDSLAGAVKLTEPKTVYKKVHCSCSNLQTFFAGTSNKITRAVATLEIPAGGTAVRPHAYNAFIKKDNGTYETVPMGADFMRTDQARVVDIDFEPLKTNKLFALFRNCKCEPMYYKQFEYKEGELHTPTKPLDTNTYHFFSSGIHFFPEKEQAERY